MLLPDRPLHCSTAEPWAAPSPRTSPTSPPGTPCGTTRPSCSAPSALRGGPAGRGPSWAMNSVWRGWMCEYKSAATRAVCILGAWIVLMYQTLGRRLCSASYSCVRAAPRICFKRKPAGALIAVDSTAIVVHSFSTAVRPVTRSASLDSV